MPVRPLLFISPRDFSDPCRIRATTRTSPFTGGQPTMAAAESRLETQTAIDAHVERLRRHLRKRLASEEDVSDIAQEACLKMLQAPHPESIDNPRAYLFQIAQHLTYRHYRHHARQRIDNDIVPDELESGDAGPEAATIDALRRQQINRAVRELPPKCQKVLRLRWSEGLKVLEIAERMGLSRAMVKKYLATGLAHCRKRLQRYATAAPRSPRG